MNMMQMFNLRTWKSFWYFVKNDISIKEVSNLLAIKEQSVRNKISRDAAVTVEEFARVMSFVEGVHEIRDRYGRLMLEYRKEE